MKGALCGKRILVTRPLAQTQGLATLIERAGGQALILPLLQIEPITSPQWPETVTTPFDWVIFTSVNAVHYALAGMQAAMLRAAARHAAIGHATAQALAAHGLSVACVPSAGFNSEALLAETAFQNISGQSVLLVKGEGGRTLLAETLRERGARLSVLHVYRRLPPTAEQTQQWRLWLEQGIDAVTLTSGEACTHLIALTPSSALARLLAVPLVVVSTRLATLAHEAGFLHIAVAAAPADAAVIEALRILFTGESCGRID